MDEEGFKKQKVLCVSLVLIMCMGLIATPSDNLIGKARAGSVLVHNSEADFTVGTFESVSMVGSGPGVELKLNAQDTGKWILTESSFKPQERHGHVITSIFGTDMVLLFGGFNGKYYNDTWIYDVSEDRWTNMNPPGPSPSPRHSSSATCIFGTNLVLLFGGFTESGVSNETWIYDFQINIWNRIISTNIPKARESHDMEFVYNDDRIVLFGGYNQDDYLSDTWIFDFSDSQWTQVFPPDSPSPRKGHEMTTIFGTQKILLFGGNQTGNIEMNDTWCYDLLLNQWMELDPLGEIPTPRQGQGMASCKDTHTVLLFGPDDMTFIYNLDNNTWTLKPHSVNPGPRNIFHGVSSIYTDDKVILFGGGIFNGTWHNYNDTWIYDFIDYEEQGVFISAANNLGFNANLDTLVWSALTPPETSIKFQLRTAPTQGTLEDADFVGPDGQTGSFYMNGNGEPIWNGHDGDLWLQYKIYFSGNPNSTPALHEVIIQFNCIPHPPQTDPMSSSGWITMKYPTFSWSFVDIDGVQAAFQVLIDDNLDFSSVDYDSGVQNSSSQSWQFPLNTPYGPIPDGQWFWKVRAQDNDGDWGEFSQPESCYIDTKPPVSILTNPAISGFNKGISTISGTAIDPEGGSGLSGVDIALKRFKDDHYWSGFGWVTSEVWFGTSGLESWEYQTFEAIFISGNQYQISSRATDLAGNIETPTNAVVFTIDSDPPVSAVNPLIHGAFLQKIDTISGTASDKSGSGISSVQISIISNSDGRNWNGMAWEPETNWLSVAGKTSWSYSTKNVDFTSDFRYTIRTRAIDNVGNIGYGEEDCVFTYDHSAPTKVSILINNGDTFTKDTMVVLTLYAEDSGSGLDKMSFSSDAKTWGPWEDFAILSTYNMDSQDGLKTIYFKVMDRAGNEGTVAYDSITLDTKIPISDSDGDGVADEKDAFPQDAAASVDSDSDGYPDSWNPGKTQGHSTTGLSLDKFPHDPLKYDKKTETKATDFATYWFPVVAILSVVLLLVFLILMRRNRNE